MKPTKVNFFFAMYLCLLAIFWPKKLVEKEKEDNARRNDVSTDEDRESNAYIVNRAFWNSFGLILVFGLSGALTGKLLFCKYGQAGSITIITQQIIGACLLLWGTLFVRGWEIQTYKGVTLTERVNQWIYRTMYCLGTAILVCSIVWSYS
ncbi:MAG: hypothetical protein PHY73_01745 [Candidatus Omnitrophica bacterium]|nr:hypothetical protein [Candidatus Omnitrophota bacterium]